MKKRWFDDECKEVLDSRNEKRLVMLNYPFEGNMKAYEIARKVAKQTFRKNKHEKGEQQK